MNNEIKIKLAYRVALISGIFCGIVALMLLINFWHMKQHEPLESATIEALVQRLKAEPNNEELKQEIRSFDLLARKAYFTSRWQIKAGTYLLLVGGILMAISLKVFTDLRARIQPPEEVTEELLKARANAQYWLMLAGGIILGLAFTAAILNNDYLKDYEQVAAADGPAEDQGGVEVIEVFASDQDAASDTVGVGDEGVTVEGEMVSADEAAADAESARPESAPITASASFSRDDFKKNHATFRGYMGLGVSYHKNIPEQWDGSAGTKVKWKVALSKPGFNSPVIWGDKIFISGGDASARIVACYNRNTGQLMWEKEVTGIPGSPTTMPNVTEDTGLAAPTMAVDGKRVYAIFASGNIIAFDMNGNKIWGRNLGVPSNHYAHSSSLMVWANKVVVQYDTHSGGRLLALNSTSGETLWDVNRPVAISWASPALIETGGKMQVVTTSDPFVMGNDLESGEEVWKVDAMMGEVAPSIAFEDGLVFATNEYARLIAVEPKPDAEFVWENDEYLAEVASPVAYNGLLYIATSYGVLVCYDTKTGEKYWEKEYNDGFYSSPMIADGKLYIIDMGGVTHIIKADKAGTVIADPKLGEGGFALPVFADGVLYLRGSENLYCIEK